MTDKQAKFILEVTSDPTLAWDEAAVRAGYSKKRAKVVASLMRKHAGVKAKIAAIEDRRLQSAPTIDSYHATRNAAKEMAQRHGDSTSAAWILLQIATMEGRELQQSEPKGEKAPMVVQLNFVDSPLPEAEVAAINRSAAEFEAKIGAPGFMGRLRSSEEAPRPEPPCPVDQKKKAKANPPTDDRWLRCERHGKFWNVASCPSCDALQWQDKAYRAAVN